MNLEEEYLTLILEWAGADETKASNGNLQGILEEYATVKARQ